MRKAHVIGGLGVLAILFLCLNITTHVQAQPRPPTRDDTRTRPGHPGPEVMEVGCSVSCNNAPGVPNVSCSATGPKSTCKKENQNLTCEDGTNTTTCNCSLGKCETK
jgi:hypothetical protein